MLETTVNDPPDSTLPAKASAVAAGTSLTRLLIAASGTGGHVFPAIAVAERLTDCQVEWLGVSNRLETQLVPERYPLHTVAAEGFQKRGLDSLRVALKLIGSIWQVRQLLHKGRFQGVFTTGGYIAAPAVLAARSLGLPVILHESNALPGKVTRFLGPWCSTVAIGFAAAAAYLPRAKTVCTGTPVRSQFQTQKDSALPIALPETAPLLVVVGGSQGAVGVNRLVRQCAPAWFEADIWIVHLTGENDPDSKSLQHPQYEVLPFYDDMAGLLRRADLVISRSGAGTLTELAMTHKPSILIPYPFAAEDHQTYNATVFSSVGAAKLFQQADLTPERLTAEVMSLLGGDSTHMHPSKGLKQMAEQAGKLAVTDSAEQLAQVIRQALKVRAERK
ncbi:undecaprenyldiphospho-muramoylpentapeptide beta-N-acetylglucosaminyltransferase [Stenomitos frigidus]|uniref:UDP-N-acetylglucosamine--N-acetylmuramyl-(pentapeptide) pyrophosphoryl-undecaprenol N-acetylglucosamine transferase n=1 Tax=Stenomitos frigidus ULC18 TaxID=2107698 RepID=A0A2T1E6F5_9CYAN|nr:undecaprenyldiphospho-muramoylpentapeptide beta-N-acetylglucosaminyltransferase [Stenomitos frigidus]PSB28265.1 undecaprenyldiphospho-muramoylpentapeptide beta-N-acetylglucosaminyltransferase [Stenomitos frigidus ULC18]